MFVEIHIDALLNKTLTLHSDYKLNNEDIITSGAEISQVRISLENVPLW
jgi:hypothetical protein